MNKMKKLKQAEKLKDTTGKVGEATKRIKEIIDKRLVKLREVKDE